MIKMKNILQELVNNSKNAIDTGIYDISVTLPNSGMNLEEIISKSQHAPLITEVKLSLIHI